MFFTVLSASVIFAEEQKQSIPVDPKLEALNKLRPVLKTVKKFYPKVSSLLFMQNLHFEDSTRLYVESAITKLRAEGESFLETVRGPEEGGGVWCDIFFLEGSSKSYSRAEGALERKHFVEHKIYQDLHGINHHLHVTLRVPKGSASLEFVKEFKSLIRSCSRDFMTGK
jgi:hypothetical protein